LLLLLDDLLGVSSSTLREDLRQELFLDEEDEEGPARLEEDDDEAEEQDCFASEAAWRLR